MPLPKHGKRSRRCENLDSKPRGPRQRAHRAERAVLRPAGQRRTHHLGKTQVAPEGQGYISTPGIYSAEQVAGWKCVTSAVDACGGRMVLQLWHVGRISHPSFQPGGAKRIFLLRFNEYEPTGRGLIRASFFHVE
jgi:2,4-dienoyl-CoA reductase-like NADH-dependent reductase (Old Yellow Enzyme family)